MMRQLIIFSLLLLIITSLISCEHSRRRETRSINTERKVNDRGRTRPANQRKGKTVVKMQKKYGVYHVPCKVNGTEMEFIFDTGASDITMSVTEARFLYKQDKLVENDFIGTQQYQIADGSIHEGLTVILRKVEIGGRTLYNVQASVMDNEEAPLLLGQSALAEFGRISIDYNLNQITFE